MNKKKKGGFTLIELLTVIAIIGILAGIIIPTVGAVRISANKAKTKVQFSQWATAMALFKQEYGYYPSIATSNKVDSDKFAGALTGRTLAGVKSATNGNTKGLSFYSISDNELNSSTAPTALVDAFGNTEIAVFTDTDGDGVINGTDGLSLQSVKSIDNVTLTPTASNFSTSTGVRAGVIFYSAGRGAAVNDIVYSWQ